ncbi:alpha-ribazole phosphatase [Dyadobacter sp. LJ53]|uniref:alpha-ribazole phosphatase n=1 Tax=Dyadobacter chenwenxiniae TaxID=2906456 RepID=UPI001F25D1DF|nr:alpha-ribazole phosphatase [Dyadobacter chenwenxiniae]MCF0052559.1 alpha-ribazole phosphatase [Dyadobacter chenwenxiniae]
MEIYLIRHTTPLITAGHIYGWSDIPLAETFLTEVNDVRKQLHVSFDRVYSSPSTRCLKLATKISEKVFIDERLRELHFGDWEGERWDTVDQNALQIWMDDFVNVCIPGGESMLQMEERLRSFWNELMENDVHNVALVTHAGAIRILLALHQRMDLNRIFDIQVCYGQVFHIKSPVPYR